QQTRKARRARRAVEPAGDPQASGMRQQSVEEDGSHHPIPSVLWRGQRAGHLHHRSELDTRRAGRLAGSTVKALIDVRLESRVVEGHQPERGFFDLPHASARAGALVMQDSDGWTFREAESAVVAAWQLVPVDDRCASRYSVV